MSLKRQTSILTNEHRGGLHHALRYSLLFRVLYIWIALVALMAVTISTYQGTENLIGWVSQCSI